jgi:ABC-2 type transport system permease protein
VKRDALLYLSYRWRFAIQVASVFVSISLFYYVSRLVSVEEFSPATYFAFVIVGIAVLEILTATLTTMPAVVRGELMTGTFERLVVSPVGPVGSIVAMAIFPVLLAFVVGSVTIGLGVLVFGLPLVWSTAPLALPVGLLGVLSFLPLALFVAAAVLLVKQAGTAAAFFVTGLSLAGGAFFPVDLLPTWVAWISEVQPLTPALELLRYALVGRPLDGSGWVLAGKLVGFALVMGPISLAALHMSINACRRRGTLIEY